MFWLQTFTNKDTMLNQGYKSFLQVNKFRLCYMNNNLYTHNVVRYDWVAISSPKLKKIKEKNEKENSPLCFRHLICM